MLIFRSLPIQVFTFAMLPMHHGKRKTSEVPFRLARLSKIFYSYGFKK